uniref:Uncharacterized protein n=1 Tax=Romanomermis culicivorax TaxID=13658 RepID=A0A915IZP7_ROMCU
MNVEGLFRQAENCIVSANKDRNKSEIFRTIYQFISGRYGKLTFYFGLLLSYSLKLKENIKEDKIFDSSIEIGDPTCKPRFVTHTKCMAIFSVRGEQPQL